MAVELLIMPMKLHSSLFIHQKFITKIFIKFISSSHRLMNQGFIAIKVMKSDEIVMKVDEILMNYRILMKLMY